MALLEADVEFNVAKGFIARVKDKALGEEVLRGVAPGQQIVKIFHDELTALLGGDNAPLNLDKPARIMMVGLNGAGKTTSSAKLAAWLKKQGRAPLLIACDLHRPSGDRTTRNAGEAGRRAGIHAASRREGCAESRQAGRGVGERAAGQRADLRQPPAARKSTRC